MYDVPEPPFHDVASESVRVLLHAAECFWAMLPTDSSVSAEIHVLLTDIRCLSSFRPEGSVLEAFEFVQP